MSTAVKHKQTWILYSEGVKHGPQYKTDSKYKTGFPLVILRPTSVGAASKKV